MQIDQISPILVTGASGYVASHTIKQLLEAGYKVRGTVRSTNNPKNNYLYSLVPEKKDSLELVQADLMDKISWENAAKGCKYIIHIASPIALGNVKEEELIVPAVEGTLNIITKFELLLLNAAVKNGVKKVVITSSMVSMWYGNFDKLITEKDWSKEEFCGPYEKSKLRAEKAAWEFWSNNKGKLEICTIHPSLVIGPGFSDSLSASEKIIADLMMAKFPGVPHTGFGLVDVRDVALALIRAMEYEKSDGQRYIVSGDPYWMKDMGLVLDGEFSKQGYKVVKKEIGYCLIKFVSFFDKRMQSVLKILNKQMAGDDSKIQNELGVKLRDPKKALIEMGYKLIENKAIPDKRKKNKK